MKTKISRQLEWYHRNKKTANKNSYLYRKKLMAIGRYVVKNNLLDDKTLKKLTKFIFEKQ